MIDLISFMENILFLLYSRYETLMVAPEKNMHTGVSGQNMYNSAIRAIPKVKGFSKQIAEAVGVENNYAAKHLSSLIRMQILKKGNPLFKIKRSMFHENQKNASAGSGSNHGNL